VTYQKEYQEPPLFGSHVLQRQPLPILPLLVQCIALIQSGNYQLDFSDPLIQDDSTQVVPA
jgi:hypothetical protein